jgi:hypothetical protein
MSSPPAIGVRRIGVPPLRSDFWTDFYGTRGEHDGALAQTVRTVRAIRGADRPRGVPEEIRAALTHLCAAMDGLVEWMEQEQRLAPEALQEALQLIDRLRALGDGVVRCLAACPLDMVAQQERQESAPLE